MKLKLVLVAAAMAVAGTVFAQETNPNVTFSMKASTVDKIVDALAKQTGAKIAASPSIAGEVVLVSVTDVPLESLLARLADAVSGEWSESDGIRYLRYDDSLFRKRAREASAQRVAELKKSIEESIKESEDVPEPEGEMESAMRTAMAQLPWISEDVFVMKILQRMDLEPLVAIQDARYVYSNRPTRVQRPLPRVDDLIQQMIAEHNRQVAEMEKMRGEEEEEEDPQTVEERRRQEQMERMFGGMFNAEQKPITAPPAKILLVVERGGLNIFGSSADLTMYDAEGKAIYTASASLGDDLGWGEVMEMVLPGEEGEEPRVDTTSKIEFSEHTLEMMRLFNMNSINMLFGPGPKLSEGLWAALRQPDVTDPLAFAPSDSLLFLAKDRKLDVVAALPDAVISMADIFGGQEQTVGSFVERLQRQKALVIETKDGWFTVRPSDPDEAKLRRVNRAALAKLIRIGEKGFPTLDDIAEYALVNDSPMRTQLVMPYITLFVPSVFGEMMMGGGGGWTALRLYGSLNLSQKQVLRESGRMAISSLTPAQRSHVEMILYGPETSLEVVDPSAPQEEMPGFMRMLRMFGGGSGDDFRTEPTEVMPNGLPPQGILSGRLTNKPIMTPAEGLLSKLGFDAEMLALFRMAMEQPEAAAQMPQLGNLRLGQRTTLELKFVVAPNVEQNENLSSDAPSTDAASYTLDNLPPVMKIAIDREIAKLRRTGMYPGGGGGG